MKEGKEVLLLKWWENCMFIEVGWKGVMEERESLVLLRIKEYSIHTIGFKQPVEDEVVLPVRPNSGN